MVFVVHTLFSGEIDEIDDRYCVLLLKIFVC